MRCGHCGSDNPDYAIYCAKCGQTLPRTSSGDPSSRDPSQDYGGGPHGVMKPQMAFCSRCGKEISAQSSRCAFCGEYPWVVAPTRWEQVYDTSGAFQYDDVYLSPPRTSNPVIGGIMAILAGVFSLGMGLLYMAGFAMISLPGAGILCVCGGIFVIFGLASIYGGILSLKRESWGFALVGAILGMLGFGFLIGFVFGLIAVIFIAISQDEFS